MVANEFPDSIQLHEIGENGLILDGVIALPRLLRLHEYIESDNGCVGVSIKIERFHLSLIVIRGRIEATIEAICQRCLQPFDLKLNSDISYALIEDEKQSIPVDFEPLVISGEVVELLPTIEDEIILALPMYPTHEEQHCTQQISQQKDSKDDQERNPFSGLKQLKLKDK